MAAVAPITPEVRTVAAPDKQATQRQSSRGMPIVAAEIRRDFMV
jgi:hypothetical protein